MRTRRVWIAAAVVVIASLGALSKPARGEPDGNLVADWNAIAATSIISTAAQSPQAAVLSLAMVQGAVYDAVNAIDGGHTPYLTAPAAEPSYSEPAAAATAAFRVLVGFPERVPPLPGLFPTQLGALQPRYDASLASLQEGTDKAGGIAVGEAAATAILVERTGDHRFDQFTVVEGQEPGQWRKTPPNFGGDPAAWVANVTPFLVPSVELLRTDGPNPLSSGAYAANVNEVKELGALNSTTRTMDQTAAAIFWQDSGPAIWNRIFRGLVDSEQLDLAQSARLLAMTSLAGADGSIGCWNDKYHWRFWRPITAIREAANDGNPTTDPDPTWLPLFNPTVPVSGPALVTPGFPDHPSGHTCISGAYVHALQAFFGTDKMPFTATSNKCSPAPCPERSFDRFSEALKEIIDARVWSGIHFRTADVQGAVLGKKVVHYMQKHYFQPAE